MSIFSKNEPSTGTTEQRISVIAQIHAKAGSEDKVRSIVEKLVEPSLKEPGAIVYKVLEDKHYPGSFFTYEEWESEAALDQHLLVNKEALNGLKALLQQDLRISVLKLTA